MGMDIRELRIGSHVLVSGVEGRVVRLSTLNWGGDDCWHVVVRGVAPDDGVIRETGCFADDEALKPICIAPELLVRLGFVAEECNVLPDGRYWKKTCNGFLVEVICWGEECSAPGKEWEVDIDNVDDADVGGACVGYLHELENIIYQCCGVELIED